MIKATLRKPPTASAQVIDVETAESADQLARELGVETGTCTVGTADGAEIVHPTTTTGTGPTPTNVSASPGLALNTTRTASSIAVPDSAGALQGEFDESDLKTPQLKIVNGSGELSQKYNQGTLIFADETLWLPPSLLPGAKNPTLIFVPVRIKKQFRENLTPEEVQEGLMPRVVSTRDAAEAIHGPNSTQWVGNEKPRWSPSAACLFLIQEPEHQDRATEDRHPGFTFAMDGKNWAFGMYYSSGTAYSESAKVILSNAYTVLREKDGRIVLHKRLWSMGVIKKRAGSFQVFVPALRLQRDNTGPEATAMIEQITGQPAAA